MVETKVYLLDEENLHADPRPSEPRRIHLSITESAASTIGPGSAIWYFDAATNPAALSLANLRASLQKTLVFFPQLCGRLQWVPFREGGNQHEREGRLSVEYGTPGDRGVRFITAFCPKPLASVVPSREERGNCWRHDSVPGHLFCPDEVTLALQDGYDVDSGPTFIIKLTRFACGGMAIALRECHVMFDAHSILRFMRDWAAMHRAYIAQEPLPNLTVKFEPHLIAEAAGAVDAAEPDQTLVEISRSLPIHRYDWWASAENAPEVFYPWTQKPKALHDAKVPAAGEKMPWRDWDMKTPTSHYRVHFSPTEIDGMYGAASQAPSSGSRISRLDAIQAHLWCLINRARGLVTDDDPVYWNYAINFRNRLSRPLGDDFMGNPMILAYAAMTGRESATASPAQIAAAIRNSVVKLTPETIPAMLHDHIHQICAQRYLQWFAGRRHVSATAWFHHGAQRMDFGTGRPLRMLDPRVPDYFVLMVEGEPQERRGSSSTTRWYDDGIDVILNLETTVLEKLLRDPLLRAYEAKEESESHRVVLEGGINRTLAVRYGPSKAIDAGSVQSRGLTVA